MLIGHEYGLYVFFFGFLFFIVLEKNFCKCQYEIHYTRSRILFWMTLLSQLNEKHLRAMVHSKFKYIWHFWKILKSLNKVLWDLNWLQGYMYISVCQWLFSVIGMNLLATEMMRWVAFERERKVCVFAVLNSNQVNWNWLPALLCSCPMTSFQNFLFDLLCFCSFVMLS